MPYYGCPSCGVTCYSAAGHSTVGECPECATPLGSGSTWLRPGEPALRRTLPARPDSPREARRSIATLAVAEATRARLDSVVTELITNAVKHAHPVAHNPGEFDRPIDLLVTQTGDEVRVAVHDLGRGFSPTDVALEREEGAHGLVIVDSLSTAWGVNCGDGNGNGPLGCTVWCTVEAGWAA